MHEFLHFFFFRGLHSPLLIEISSSKFECCTWVYKQVGEFSSHFWFSLPCFLPRFVSFAIRLWWWELSYYKVLSRPNRVSLSVLPQVLSLLLPPLALEVTLSKGLHRLFTAKKHEIHWTLANYEGKFISSATGPIHFRISNGLMNLGANFPFMLNLSMCFQPSTIPGLL